MIRHAPSLAAWLSQGGGTELPSGPIGVLFAESAYMLAATLEHLIGIGARAVLVFGDDTIGAALVEQPDPRIVSITAEIQQDDAATEVMERLIGALPNRWIAWCYNAEFLYFPWCETRSLADLAEFLTGERRRALFSYALDLYADPLPQPETAAREAELSFDRAGYHAFPQDGGRLEIFGGLGWRFEGLVPAALQPIGRAGFFRADTAIRPGPGLRFDALDYASVSCPWHHSPTGAVMSLRRARPLFSHPSFAGLRDRLLWDGSERFDWSSRQLLELGMIEPGQWI